MKQYLPIPIIYFLSLIMLVLISRQAFAQIDYNQGFDGVTFVPAGWTNLSGGGGLWTRQNSSTFPTCTPYSSAGMARFGSHNGAAGTTSAIATPIIALSQRGSNTPTFSLVFYRDTALATTTDSLVILINTTLSLTGATPIGSIARAAKINLPDTVDAVGWYKYSFDIPSGFNTDTNYIILNGMSRHGNNIFIDSIAWDAYPPLCSGTPVAGNVLTTRTIICGSSGTATLSLSNSFGNLYGISYQWQSDTTSTGQWNNFGTNVASLSTGNITTTTSYRCYVSCSYSGLADTSSAITITVKTNPNPTVTATPATANLCSNNSAGIEIKASGAATYTWAPPTGLNATTGDSVNATPATTTTYTVMGTDTAGCIGTATSAITIRTAPTVTISEIKDSVCSGDTTHITASSFGPGMTYSWSPGGGTTATIVARPSVTTQYMVRVTNNFGCSVNDSIMLNALPLPTIIVNPDTSVCKGSNIQLSVSGGFGYLWRPSASLNDSIIPNPVATPLSTTMYKVIGTDALGCKATDSVIVTVNPLPVIVTSPDDTICPGSVVLLSASGAVTYTWSPASGLDSPVIPNPHAAPSSTTVYTVTGTDSLGCSSSSFITVMVSPSFTLSATKNTLCLGDSTTITTISPDQGLTYSWSPDGQITDAIIAIPVDTATYSVTVTDINSCSLTKSFTINVIPLAKALFGYTINGRTVTFHDSSTHSTSFIWDFGDGNGSTKKNPVYTFSNDSTFTVTLIATGACNSDTIIKNIVINTSSGIENLIATGTLLTVHANPFSVTTQIDFTLNKAGRASIKVCDLLGKEIITLANERFTQGEHSLTFSRANIANGAYLLKFTSDEGIVVRKVIIE